MIEPMAKIEIVGLMEELDSTLDMLQGIGTVEIIEIPAIEETGLSQLHRIHLDQKRADLLTGYEDVIDTAGELLDILEESDIEEAPLDPSDKEKVQSLNPSDLIDHISKVTRDIRKLGRQRKNLLEDIESTRQYESLINAFIPILEEAGPLGNREQMGIILKKNEAAVVTVLRSRIEDITGPDTQFYTTEMMDGSHGVYIVMSKYDVDAVRELLGNEGIAEYHMPKQYRSKNLKESIEAINARLSSIPKELAEVDKEINAIKIKYGALLRYILLLSTDKINQLRILSRLIRTKYTFALSGWTPVATIDNLEHQMKDTFNDRVHISRVRLTDVDVMNIPTKLTNRGMVRAFEVLMKLLPPPKYNNLDATPFITIFFPFFFGIILGDIAYGLALVAIAGIVKWKALKRSIVSDAATVALASGILTIIFGIVFGEFLGNFGEEHFGLHPLAPWLHRTNAIQVILIIAICIGVFHVLLGFALKIYISAVMKHTKGIIEGISKIVVVSGAVIIFMQLFLGYSVHIRHVGYGMILAGMGGILWTEGIFGLIELMSMFGNILSYSRIMAIGLASVILAIVANKLAEESSNIIIGIAVGVIIHSINFVMGVFSPSIHSLRLHYVEFFTKFFNSSGRPFQPFKRMEGLDSF